MNIFPGIFNHTLRFSSIPGFHRDVQIFSTSRMFSLTKYTMNPTDLMLKGRWTFIWLAYPEVWWPKKNAASYSTACSISFYCELTDFLMHAKSYRIGTSQKNTIYWLNKSACSDCTEKRHFPTTFWELRLGVISDVTVIAKSPRAKQSPNPSFWSQSVRSNLSIKHPTYRTHWSVQNDQYYLWQTGTVECHISVWLSKWPINTKVYKMVILDYMII